MEWYYADESDQQISFSEEDFPKLVEMGAINPDTLVWNASMTDWTAASAVQPAMFAPAAATIQQPVVPAPAAGGAPASQYPGGPHGQYQPQPTVGLALASMICGIIAIITTCIYISIFPGIAAIICGHKSKNKSQSEGRPISGMALAGLIMGYIGAVWGLITILLLVLALTLKPEAL